MSTFKINGQSTGIKEITAEFDKLTKAEQKMVQNLLKGDKAVKKFSGNSRLLKGLKKNIKDIGITMAGMVGANSASQIFSTVLEKWKSNLEQVVKLQGQAAQGQRTVSQSLRGLIGNDKELSKDPAKIQQFLDFSGTQGQRLGEGGQSQVLDALKDLRSATDGTDEQRLTSLTEAVSLKEFDVNTDLSSAAKSIFNVTRSLEKLNDSGLDGKDLNKVAVGFIKTLGAQFTGDASNAFGEITKLLAKKDLGVDSSQASALFAFVSKATDDTEGKISSSTTGDLLTKVLTADGKKVNGKKLNFENEGAFDRLLEFSERLKSGEFGETSGDKAKAIKSVFGEGQNTVTSILSLAGQGATNTLKNNVGSFQDSFSGVDIIARDKDVASKFVGTDLQEETKLRRGQQDRVLNQRTDLAAFDEKAKQLESIKTTLGVTDGFDIFKEERQLLQRNFTDADTFFQTELAKLFNKAGLATSVTSTEATGLGGVYTQTTSDTALGKTIKSGSTLEAIALKAIESDRVNLSDGLNQVEQAILVWAGLGEQMIQKLEDDKADRQAIISAITKETQAPPTKGEF